MSQKTAQCSVEDQARLSPPPSPRQLDRPSKSVLGGGSQTEAVRRNGEATSSSPESGSLNGDAKRSGKSRRRKKRSSRPEGRAESADESKRPASRPPGPHGGLMGLRSECASVWLERGVYERAESLYQRWLLASSSATASPPPPPSSGRRSRSPASALPSPPGPACRHGDQVACHHVVETVWVNKSTFDQAEGRFVEGSAQPPVPNSLELPAAAPNRCAAPRTPDDGYQSLTPTPATPGAQRAAVASPGRQSVNGLPRLPAELLRDVWLEKPLYDRAEAAFYQHLYGNNASKRPGCSAAAGRSGDHPHSLVEEEEEEEEEEMAVEEKRAVAPGKAEVFHALHPIQEEEEPLEVPESEEAGLSGAQYFLHPESERVWLERRRYDAAESRFHGRRGDKAAAAKRKRRPDGSPLAPSAPPRDKYEPAGDRRRSRRFRSSSSFFTPSPFCFGVRE